MKENGDSDMLWNWFKGTLEQAMELFVPHREAGLIQYKNCALAFQIHPKAEKKQ